MWIIIIIVKKKETKNWSPFFNGSYFAKENFVEILWNWKADKNKQSSSVKIVDILKQALILKKNI